MSLRDVSLSAFLSATYASLALGHGVMTFPPSTRMNGSIQKAGSCEFGECFFFTHMTEIPGEPTLNEEEFRTFNVKVSSGAKDWSRKNPWRAPGTAPVLGSGCGVAGGSMKIDQQALAVAPSCLFRSLAAEQRGEPPIQNYSEQGADSLTLPAKEPQIWHKGSVEEVAWGITANHGGGYSWRLCPKSGTVNEACFQRNVLRFAGDKQWIQYGNLSEDNFVLQVPRYEIPLVKVNEGTYPKGTEWARNPIPGCNMCDESVVCEGLTGYNFTKCSQLCAGDTLQVCPPGMTQFPEPLHGLSGHTPQPHMEIPKKLRWGAAFPFSIVDKVQVPEDLPAGDYLLSWRWDAEQSPQVWQNCADIKLLDHEQPEAENRNFVFP